MKLWKSSLRSLYSLQYIRKCFLSSIQFLFKLSISFRLLVWMRLYFHFFLFVCVRGEVLIVALYRWFNGFLTIYFGGARSKGLAMLRNVPKLLFLGQNWARKVLQAKSLGLWSESAIWRSESRISSGYLEITSSSLIYPCLFFGRKNYYFKLPRVWTGARVTRQIRWDPKLRD